MGLTSGRSRGRRVRLSPPPPVEMPRYSERFPVDDIDDEFLNIEPLLDRIERLEARVDAMEPRGSASNRSRTAAFDYTAALADLEARIEQNTRDLELLREQIITAEQRMSESVASVERSIAQTRSEIPVFVEEHVSARIEDLENRFAVELEQTQQRTLEVFERAIDEKISSRIGSIERALAEQGQSIQLLNTRTADTDSNLQRLVMAIEKLCDRAQLLPPSAQESRPQEPQLPFEQQMNEARMNEARINEAMRRDPVEVHAAAAVAGAEEPKKSRFMFRNLIVAGFGFLASRLFR